MAENKSSALLEIISEKAREDRRFITVDGQVFHLRDHDEFSLEDQASLLRSANRLQNIFAPDELGAMSDESFKVAVDKGEKSLNDTVTRIIVEDARPLLALALTHRMAIVNAFTEGNASGGDSEDAPSNSSQPSAGSTD